jgi:hypothetical protein
MDQGGRQHRYWRRGSLGILLMTALLLGACVGRPKEVHGEHPSFLPSSNGQPAAVPTNVGGNSDTSGVGAGMQLQSPGGPAATPTPAK